MKPHKRRGRPSRSEKKEVDTRDTKREPLEILAMLAGRTTYRVPVEGRSTADPSITAIDVAHALGAAPNKAGAHMALAIACQRHNELPSVSALVYPRLLKELRAQRHFPGVVAGPKKYRICLVLPEAFRDVVRPHPRRPLKPLAKAAEMNESAFRFLHRHISAHLESEAADAARFASTFLFARYAGSTIGKPGDHVAVMISENGSLVIQRARSAEALHARLAEVVTAVDIDLLLAEMLAPGARERTLGVLSLAKNDHIVVYVQV